MGASARGAWAPLQHGGPLLSGIPGSKAEVAMSSSSKVTLHRFHTRLLVTQVGPARCGWGLHEEVSTGRPGSPGSSWRLAPQLDASRALSAGSCGYAGGKQKLP